MKSACPKAPDGPAAAYIAAPILDDTSLNAEVFVWIDSSVAFASASFLGGAGLIQVVKASLSEMEHLHEK